MLSLTLNTREKCQRIFFFLPFRLWKWTRWWWVMNAGKKLFIVLFLCFSLPFVFFPFDDCENIIARSAGISFWNEVEKKKRWIERRLCIYTETLQRITFIKNKEFIGTIYDTWNFLFIDQTSSFVLFKIEKSYWKC